MSVRDCRFVAVSLVLALCCALPAGLLAFQSSVEVKEEGGAATELTRVRFDEGGLSGLRILADSGDVRCEGWDETFIEVTVTKKSRHGSESAKDEFKEFTVATDVFGGKAKVEVKKTVTFSHVEVEVSASVPRGCQIEAETGGGDIRAKGVQAEVRLDSGGGSITAGSVAGPLKIKTGGGDVDVSEVNGEVSVLTGGGSVAVKGCAGKVSCKSGGGDLSLSGCTSGLDAKTGGGDVQVQDCRGGIAIATGGGGIDVKRVKGQLSVKTGGGVIRVSDAEDIEASSGGGHILLTGVEGSVDAKTGGGGIEIEACGLKQLSEGHFRLRAGGGDVRVKIPGTLPVDVSACSKTRSLWGHPGEITCFFPLQKSSTSEKGWFGEQSTTANGSSLGGGLSIEVETGEGDISIEKC
ncbi:MAG: DUF4097 family beta strand repeat protein [Candidatus Coatesbacteria bacterium]|nr:DUF4097 family beta strand repeat protein [Candidatus Coatesbacteria bacterium]